MNPAHLHLITTHLPVLGSLFGLLLFVLGMVRKSRELLRTSLGVFVVSALGAIPTYLSGAPAGDMLMKAMPSMSTDIGDQHAEVAILAMVAVVALGLVAVIELVVYRESAHLPRWLTVCTLALALITTATMVWTASLGGQVRHTEIQSAPSARAAD